jgi:hypothetical protein
MDGSSIEEGLTNQDREPSSLTNIRGIGAVKKRSLKSIGICTVEDLARASSDEIESELKSQGYIVSHREIERWISEAQKLALELSLQQTEVLAEVLSTGETKGFSSIGEQQFVKEEQQSVENEQLTQSLVEISDGEWVPSTSFTVEFQTRQKDSEREYRSIVRQAKTEAVEIFTGHEIENLQQWMLERMNPENQLESYSQNSAMPSASVEITQLRLLQLQFAQTSQPLAANKIQQLFPAPIKSGEPFVLEIDLHLDGLTTFELTRRQMTYHAECYARYLPTGATINLGEVEANIPWSQQSSYTALLPEISLQEPGAYRLKVMVSLRDIPATPGFFKVPLLQVA